MNSAQADIQMNLDILEAVAHLPFRELTEHEYKTMLMSIARISEANSRAIILDRVSIMEDSPAHLVPVHIFQMIFFRLQEEVIDLSGFGPDESVIRDCMHLIERILYQRLNGGDMKFLFEDKSAALVEEQRLRKVVEDQK